MDTLFSMETKGILAQIDSEIARLHQVRAILTGGRAAMKKAKSPRRKRVLSAEARARISAAQKARWAKAKKAAK
jgi:hypothetical protein